MHRRRLLPLLLLATTLTGLLAPATADAYVIAGTRWPTRTIRVYETLPPSYDWSINRAIASWNLSGARVRFVKVRSARYAHVRLRFGPTHGHAGYSSYGYQRGAYVNIRGRRVLPRSQWVSTGRLLSHELGHVLGLGHGPDRGCEIMDPDTSETGCPRTSRTGWYTCRWPFPDDVRGAIRLYGGSIRRRPLFCPIEPAPSQVRNLSISGGAASGTAVRLTWTRPTRLPFGSSYQVGVYPRGRCGVTADRIASYRLRRISTSWSQPTESGAGGDRCYQLRIVNRWGWGPRTLSRTATSYVPGPAAPTITSIVEYPGSTWDYRVTVDPLPDGSYLNAIRSDSGACATSYDTNQAIYGTEESRGSWLFEGVPVGASCLSFFAVTWQGAASAPAAREVVHAAA